MTASRVVVGVDGPERSARAVKWCVDHAAALGPEVVAMRAIDLPVGPGMPPMPIPLLSPEQREEVRDVVARDWCKPLADAGIPYRVIVVDGSPALALMRVSRDEAAEFRRHGKARPRWIRRAAHGEHEPPTEPRARPAAHHHSVRRRVRTKVLWHRTNASTAVISSLRR